MNLIEEKCYIFFCSTRALYPETFFLGYTEMNVESIVELIGVKIDKDLTFENHIDNICKKPRCKLAALKRLRPFISEEKAVLLANSYVQSQFSYVQSQFSYVQSQFSYCSLIWMFCSKTLNSKINKIHERTLRTIYLDFNSSFMELLNCSNQVTIHIQNLRRLMLIVYKAVNKLLYIKQ